jgi:LEA14-like dessication related protein
MAKKTQPLYYVLLGGAGIFLAGRYLLRKGEAVKSLNVNVTGVDFNKANFGFVVKVRLINPSNASIEIKSIVADAIWNGTYAATVSYLTPFTLKPLEERTIQIPVKANLEWYQLILQAITKGTKALNGTFELKGSVNALGLVVPLTYKNTFDIIK